MNKTNEWKEQIGSSPLALALIGGTLGALIGRALGKERVMRASGQPDLRYRTAFADDRGARYGSTVDVRSAEYGSDAGWNDDRSASIGGIGEKIADTPHDLKDKAGDMVANVRDRLPSAAEVGHKADENPLLVALGGLALGAVAALLLPVSRKERELLEPVKQRAGEAIGSLGDKIGDSVQQAREKIAGQPEKSQQPSGQFTEPGFPALTH